MNHNQEIPVFFAVDNEYAPFLAVALNSAVANSSKDRNYRAIIVYKDLDEETMGRISALAADNFKVEFVPMCDGLESITNRMSNRLRCEFFTLSIYFRLFIPAMFPQYDKGIYIDSDIVLLGDIAELYDIDIGENYIGACNDLSVLDVPPLCEYMEQAVGVDRSEYVNSGVLLMNMKKLREVGIDRHFLSLLNKYHFDSIAPDQDYINAMCNGNIHYLPAEWDAMPNDSRPPLENAKLVHYNLFSKPWCYDNIQYGELFWEYAKDSGYYHEVRAYKDGYDDERKAHDDDFRKLLVDRGVMISGSDVTFRKALEKGEKIRL